MSYQNHLHLKFAVNLENLANEMIREISNAWKSPLEPPTIIFADYKLEQWFRLHYLKGKGILANLNKKSLDQFLMEILVGKDKTKKKLTSDMLRNVILAYLQTLDGNNTPNYKKLDPKISSYLIDSETGNLDENRLFDFANHMAGLYLEYETSRPGNFISGVEGILDCWKQGALKDFFLNKKRMAVEDEAWERELYAAIFHNETGDSLLTKVFKEVSKRFDSPVEYLTLPYLYQKAKENGKIQFHYNSKTPVFILGLSGMGQFYRVVLQEFAKEHEIYAYIQNPCMEFWEDVNDRKAKTPLSLSYSLENDPDDNSEKDLKENENALLVSFGKAGRDNIKIWSQSDNYSGSFDESVTALYENERKQGRNSLLQALQYTVIHRQNTFPEDYHYSENDKSITITAAPSKIREVENLHTKICKLLENGATIQDILVVSPNIADYRTAIYQVFDQNGKTTQNGIHLRFVIVDSIENKTLIGNALNTLFTIQKNGYLTRENFFTFVRNPVVQNVQGITQQDISSWETWVSDMNIYRDHREPSNQKEDWIYGVRRLLLYRLTEDIQKFGEEEYLPYANLDSENDSSLLRFVEIVLSLENWIKKSRVPITQNPSKDSLTIQDIQEFFNSFLLMQNAPRELAGESIIYSNVLKGLQEINYQFAAGLSEISWNITAETIKSAANSSEFSRGNLFVGGISFMKFAPNRIIPVKHLFFLGANGKDFPGSKSFDNLDLRKSVAPWPGDDTPIEKNRYAFLCQLMSTSESFHISYQNKYLPKDQDLFPSSVVNDLKKFVQNASKGETNEILPITELSISEDRPNEDLYSERSYRSKKAFLKFNDEKNTRDFSKEVSDKTETNPDKFPKQVNAYDIKEFLTDPFEFQINKKFDFDSIESTEKNSVEPIHWTPLQKSSALKYNVAKKLNIQQESNNYDENMLRLQGSLPLGTFGEILLNDIDKSAEEIKDKIHESFKANEWEFSSLPLEVNIPRGEGFWTLSANIKILAKNSNKMVLINIAKDTSTKHFLYNYISALAIIADGSILENRSIEIQVLAEKNKSNAYPIEATPEAARNLLNEIYKKMYVEKYQKIIPIRLLNESIQTPMDFSNKLKEKECSWNHFSGKDLFDERNPDISGFSINNFLEDWNEAKKMMINLMPHLNSAFEEKSSTKGKNNG